MNAAGFSLNDIERGALSSAMASASALTELASYLTAEHFTIVANLLLFAEQSREEKKVPAPSHRGASQT